MSSVTLRLSDDKHHRLKALAKRRGVSGNRLIEEITTLVLAEVDAEIRFAIRAARACGRSARGNALLDKAAGRPTRRTRAA